MTEWKKILMLTGLEIPILGFLIFMFYYPNIVFPPIGDLFFNYFFLFFIVTILVGIPVGFTIEDQKSIAIVVILSTVLSYFYAGILFYFPFLLGNVWTPDLSALYFNFIKITFLLIIPIIFGLFIGCFIGNYYLDKLYTKQIKQEERI